MKMVMIPPRARVQHATSSCILIVILLATTKCYSWNVRALSCQSKIILHPYLNQNSKTSLYSQVGQDQRQRQQVENEGGTTSITRRKLIFESMITTQFLLTALGSPNTAIASSPNGIVTVRLESSKESLGVEIYDTTLRGKNIVAIRRIIVPNKKNQFLSEGMILQPRGGGIYTAKDLAQILRYGPFPLEVDFLNLAAGGDAISDMGTSIVTPKDALELAQKTENSTSQQQKGGGYSITTLQQTQQTCAIQSRRNDVLEIEYEASYIVQDGTINKKILYDASAFRGTGNRPYQMVLGSGDMIPGVDQGLYDMCPGDKRLLTIPPVLGHGPNSRKLYNIPDNHQYLEWEVRLVTIDSTVKEDNNDASREDRESRFAY